jgi:uracil-DNA glycosylase
MQEAQVNIAGVPKMHQDRAFLAAKKRRVGEPHVLPLNDLAGRIAERTGRDVPQADPDSGGIHSRILFLHESPGPKSPDEHGSGLISLDNNDPSAERFWRLSRDAGRRRDIFINWNAVPWYVSATSKNTNSTDADGQAALPYLHEFVTLLPELRVVVAMGAFAQRWWFRYLTGIEGSRVQPLLGAPHTSSRARISRPDFEDAIETAMVKALQIAET